MSDNKLAIEITARNGAKVAFDSLVNDSQRASTALERMETSGKRSFAGIAQAGRTLGAGLGTLTVLSTKVAGDAEAAEARIETAFQNAGLAIEDFQAQIDQLASKGLKLAFDDEDVTDSLAQLITVTKDYERAVQDVGLAQDIARARRISLAQATDIVAGAEAGRFRSLQMMGVVLDETATKEDYLAAAQQRFAGQSEAFAATGAASWERYQNSAENALESVGGALNRVQGPLIALSAGGAVIGTLKSAMDDLGATSKVTALALGPAGLVGAAGLAVTGLILLGRHLDGARLDAGEATESIDDFVDSIARIGAAGAGVEVTQGLASFVDDLEALAAGSVTAREELEKLKAKRDEISQLQAEELGKQFFDEKLLEQYATQIQLIDQTIESLNRAVISEKDFKDVQNDINDIVTNTARINYPILIDRLNELTEQFRAGEISADEYVKAIDELQENADKYGLSLDEMANQTRGFTNELYGAGHAVDAFNDSLSANPALKQQLLQSMVEVATRQFQEAQALDMAREAMDGSTDATEDALPKIQQYADLVAEQEARAREAAAALRDYAEALGLVPAIADTSTAQFASRASAAGASLSNAFRVAVGNTNDIGSQSEAVAKWARELINVEGSYGKIDDLLAQGAITQEEYNAAQEAGNQIFAANERIQQDVLAIQAQQAPIIADLAAQQANYLDAIARLPAEQQAVALAYMDTATAAKAQEAMVLAAAAANGELGEAGMQAAENMIVAAAEADPYLKLLLEDMGLISVGADGTITINFGSVEDAGASLDDVVESIESLKELLADIFNVDIDTDAPEAKADIDAVGESARDLDGTNATVTVNADTTSFWDKVNGLIGSTVGTAYLALDYLGIAGQQLHGGVVGYADGGVVARMAEGNRPELLHSPDGGMGLALTDGLYNVPRGTYVTPAPATKAALGNLGGGLTVQFNAPVTIVANDPRQFQHGLHELAMSGVRP